MKRTWVFLIGIVVVCCHLFVAGRGARAAMVVFTSPATIAATNLAYEGFDITVQACTLTVEGDHAFGSLTSVASGAVAFAGKELTLENLVLQTNATLRLAGGSKLNVGGSIELAGNSVVLCQGLNTTGRVEGAWAGVGVTVAAGSVRVDATSRISADGQGYTCPVGGGSGNGPGGGGAVTYPAGGGHGGTGGWGQTWNGIVFGGGATYGSAAHPTDLGSAGGNGGAGGGAMRLTVAGSLTLDGLISADGAAVSGGGGGAGGSIWIDTHGLAGQGALQARGASADGAGGGGGRIAVYYATSAFVGVTNCSVRGGAVGVNSGAGQAGTLGFFDTSVPESHLMVYQRFAIEPSNSVKYGAVTLADGGQLGVGNGAHLEVSGQFCLTNGSALTLGGGSWLQVGGALDVLSNSVLSCRGLNTTGRVEGAWAGVGVTVAAGSVRVDATSRISADGQGYTCPVGGGSGNGPGGGGAVTYPAGGGHGGTGGWGQTWNGIVIGGGATYGSAAHPTDLGSAGGNGGAGGGAMRLTVAGSLTLDGLISADGAAVSGGGGGAGGSIWIDTHGLAGQGALQARGASADGAGGGGGRIAVYYATSAFVGVTNCSVKGGAVGVNSGAGQAGTLAFFDTSIPESHLMVYQRFAIEPATSARYGRVTVVDGGEFVLGHGAHIEVSGELSVSNHSALTLGGDSWLHVGGALDVLNNSTMVCQGLNTTGQVNHAWAGVGVAVEANSMSVDSSSSVTADGQGYTCPGINKTGNGPGGGRAGWWGGPYASGAGHGGVGGSGDKYAYKNPGGAAYGSAAYPLDLGSAGGGSDNAGGPGGGAIHLTIREALNLDGNIRAQGGGCTGDGAGGAGGSILISARAFAGAGSISANGGEGSNASGAGGRVALYYWGTFGLQASNVTAAAAAGFHPGQNGSVRISNAPQFVWLQPSSGLCHGVQTLAWTVLAVDPFELTTEVRVTGPARDEVLTSGAPSMGDASWNTTGFADGVYELRASFFDAAGALAGEAIQSVLVNNAVVWHSGYIESNEVWTAGAVHVVEGTLTVGAGATLTIQPGAVVKHAEGARWILESGAAVDALGAEGANIVITSLADDTAGGDSNLDGSQSGPRPGVWAVTGGGGAGFRLNAFADIRYGTALHSGSIAANEVWSGTMLHRITGDVTVGSGAAVTIQPGAVVKFDPMLMLTVNAGARLDALGTLSQPITFTSIKDDAAGGDTNGDGDGTSPAPGDWRTILLEGGQAQFDHALIAYAAGTPDGLYDGTGAIRGRGASVATISNSVIRSTFFQGVTWGGSELTMANTVIAQTDRAVGADAGITRLINCTIEDNRVGLFGHGGDIEAVNTIVSDSLETGVLGLGTASSLRYCDVWSATGVNYVGKDWTGESGNISVDPKFGDPDSGNYRLSFRSPCIDAADGAAAPSLDHMGAPRYDDPRTANTGLAMAGGAFADMGAFEFVETAISDVDLVVTLVSGPKEATAGRTATISWTIANRGTGRAVGPWHDAVALVPHFVTSVASIPVAEVLSGHGLTLGPGESAGFSAQVRVPGGTEGPWLWQIRANSRAEVFEGSLLDNNTLLALAETELRVPGLTVGTAQSGAFAGVGVPSWFKLDQLAGQELLVTLDAATLSGRCRVYAGFEKMPSESSFDLRSAAWDSPDARLALPAPFFNRTVFLFVAPEAVGDGLYGFTILAQPMGFALERVGLASAGNSGRATVPVLGSGFAPGLAVSLRQAGSPDLAALSVGVVDSTRADATFDLAGVAPGIYSVVAYQGGRELALTSAFTVKRGVGGQLWMRLVLPSAVRVGREALAYIEYGNSGDADLEAPLLQLGYDGAPKIELWANPKTGGSTSPSQEKRVPRGMVVLGVALDGTQPGVLRPGCSYSIPVGVRTEASGVFKFGVHRADELWTAPKYDYLGSLVAPFGGDAVWRSAWLDVVKDAGPAWEGYLAALRGAATRTRQYGLGLTEETDLLRFLIEEKLRQTQTAPVAGRLFLADTNHPLANERLRFLRKDATPGDSNSVFWGSSWYDGSFSVMGVVPGAYLVSAIDYLPETAMEIQLTDPILSPLTNLVVIVASRGGEVSGLITAGVRATPVAGAMLTARQVGTAIQYPAATDTNGSCVITGLPAGDYQLELDAPGYLPQPSRYFSIKPGERIYQSYCLPLTGGRVMGRVLTVGGEPVAGARVAARWQGAGNPFGAALGYEDLSAATGDYRIAGLPPGTYQVAASADGVGVSTLVTNLVITDLNASVSLDLVLRAGAALRGVVLDAVTRSPVAGATVQVRAMPGVKADALTDSLGQFELSGLGVDNYSVLVRATGYLPVQVQAQIGAAITPPLAIELGVLGSVRGRVASRGTPLPGVPVFVLRTNGVGDVIQTDALGNYGFTGLPPGSYRVAVGPRAGPHIWGEDFTVSSTNASNITRDFNFDSLSTVFGHAYGGDASRPLTNATILLVKNSEPIVETTTDFTGSYGFYIQEPGVFDVYARVDGQWLTPSLGVVVGTNQQVVGVDLVLPTNQLTVTITAQVGGTPLTQAVVRVEAVAAASGLLVRSGRTTDDGTCAISSLPFASYRVRAWADGFGYAEQTLAVTNSVSSLALALPPGRKLHGTVTTNGFPAAGVLVEVALTNRGVLFSAQTDDRGRYEFDSLPEGRFILAVLPDSSYLPFVREDIQTDLSPHTQVEVALVAAGGATISGVARDATGQPAVNSWVSLLDSNNLTLAVAVPSAATGGFVLESCPAGSFTVVARRQGCLPVRQEVVAAAGTVRSNLSLNFAAPVAWPATRPVLLSSLVAVWNPRSSKSTMESWLGGLATGLQPPNEAAGWQIAYLNSWFDEIAKFKRPDCGYWQEPDPRVLDYANKARRAYQVWEDAYESDFALAAQSASDLYWANVQFQAALALTIAGLAVTIFGAEAFGIASTLLTIGGILTTLLGTLVAYLSGGLKVSDWTSLSETTFGNLEKLLKNVASELAGAVGTCLGIIGLALSLASVKDALSNLDDRLKDATSHYDWAKDNFWKNWNAFFALKDMKVSFNVPCPTHTPGGTIVMTSSESVDPNAKLTIGIGPGGWVPIESPIAYTIQFENKADASAPAQQVVVTDQLAPELDWSTLELQQIGFNDVVLDVPPGLQSYSASALVGSDPNPVSVEAILDPDTGLLVWTLTSVDAGTGRLTEDPLAGFLPPNDVTHRGEGYLTFTVRPKSGWPSGTLITNQASIVFDVNKPIPTQVVTNTLDAGLPTSHVLALPLLNTNAFLVQWAGQDDPGGSGIDAYDVFYSSNGVHYERWLEAVRETSAHFIGEPGRTYSFYSVAVDMVGHREQKETVPDVTTTIDTNCPPVIPPLGGYVAQVGRLFRLQPGVVASPAQHPVFSLAPGSPAGTVINPTSGLLSWKPQPFQASTTNTIAVRVADSATPAMTSEQTLTVIVDDYVQIDCGATAVVAGSSGSASLTVFSSVGLTNLTFLLSMPNDRLTNQYIQPLTGLVCAAAAEALSTTNTRFEMPLCQGQVLRGTQAVGGLGLTALPNVRSGFVPLFFTDLRGQRTDGTWLTNLTGSLGRIAVLGDEPLLEAHAGTDGALSLTVYSTPGSTCRVESCASLPGAIWRTDWELPFTNRTSHTRIVVDPPPRFFRAGKL